MNCIALSMVMSAWTVISKCAWSGMITKSWRRNFRAATYDRKTFDEQRCLVPRFASVFWTLTWAEEGSGRAAKHCQLTISGIGRG